MGSKKKFFQAAVLGVLSVFVVSACSRSGPRQELNPASQRNEQVLASLSQEISNLNSELRRKEAAARNTTAHVITREDANNQSQIPPSLLNAETPMCSSSARVESVVLTGNADIDSLRNRITALEAKLTEKRTANTLESANTRLLADEMRGHTNLYSLKGEYKVLVIPVQFSDVKFRDTNFIENQAQDYLFGEGEGTMTSYYKHASLGKLHVTGEVAPIITVDNALITYGEAVVGNSDKDARELVVQALQKLKEIKTDPTWWESFDNWDLNNYDLDNNRHEPDGFIDAVILITAGKPQSSCQASFDPDRTRPASADVPPGPRHDAAVECFNRLWPHRWSISLPHDDPRYSEVGPEVEGLTRPSMNAYKITDHVFALDYNMQSEFSDRATFIHEFGHSLTLPDIYDGSGPGNSTGEWEAMSGTGHLQAQEMSSYSKLSLGWVEPKIVKKGQTTSAYLGTYNYVSEAQRERNDDYRGPEKVLEPYDQDTHSYDVVSMTPGFGEPVYRSVVALMGPTTEQHKIVDVPASTGTYTAYSGQFDGESRTLHLRMHVPSSGDATLRFDEIHAIETETNFNSRELDIRVVTDFDIGHILINGDVREELRLISGDANNDTLAEVNPECEAARVLELRTKGIQGELSDAEKTEMQEKLAVCRKPVWVKHEYDLSLLRGQDVDVDITYVTDSGYTEFGIIVDNFELGGHKIDFESADASQLGDFRLLRNGSVDMQFNQFYLFEYRAPEESFVNASNQLLSYNMDQYIGAAGTQSMFETTGNSILERFRLFTISYQPGVLVWYYNSKYDRRTNSPALNQGKGYLLVLNSKVQEMRFPGVMGSPALFNDKGEYDVEKEDFKAFVDEQTRLHKCFASTGYFTYIDGEAPNCGDVPVELQNKIRDLKLGSQALVERREGFNDFLPTEQYSMLGVGAPMRNQTGMRTALSVFRPATEPAVNPIRVYKAVDGHMVLDTALNATAATYPPQPSFRDSENALPQNPRFRGDTVVVEKKGFGFDVVAPAPRIVNLYTDRSDGDANSNFYRRPRAKILFRWE